MKTKKKLTLFLSVIILTVISIVGWHTLQGGSAIDNPQPSVYYWRTSFKLTDSEKSFLKVHHVRKMYMRFFDVVPDGRSTVPNATIVFRDKAVDGVDIIPVVFITEECLQRDINSVADKIVERVVRMCETNDIPQPEELQIDCDYTARSAMTFFDFLKHLRGCMDRTHIKTLSVTIRLHQLSMRSPARWADYGVLMMYNTGSLRDYNCPNPILRLDDVKPYLRYLKGYDLPLCAAYPDFEWKLLFRGRRFKTILHDADLTDSTLYERVARNKYVLVSSRDMPSFVGAGCLSEHVNAGDSVFVKGSTADEILSVKDAIEKRRKGINRQVILYDLNEENINRYKRSDYEKIFNR